MNRIIIILLSTFITVTVYAQFQVKGSLSRPDATVVRSMAAVIKKQSDPGFTTTTITDQAGHFIFQLADTGTYELKLQSLFYRDTAIYFSITINDKSKNLGTIRLQPLSQTLQAVSVMTKKESIEFKDDHITFNPGADPSIGSRPLTEILSRIPGISIDSRNSITAKGQEGVQLLVNGRLIRSSAGDFLAQLNADEVDRIEIYDNATRYAYIKAPVILNVILKTRQQKKLWNAAVNMNTLPKVNPLADASFSFGKQRIYARLSHDISTFRSEGYVTRSLDTFQFYQKFNNMTRHKMSMIRLGWDYFPDSATTLTVEGNYTRHTDALNADIIVTSAGDHFQNKIRSSPVEKEISGFITYKKDQKQKGHQLFEIGITRFNLRNKRNLPGLSFTEQRDMNNYSAGFKAEWQKNLKSLKILNGFSGQLIKITDGVDTFFVEDIVQSRLYNNGFTFYHETNWQRNKWNFSLGANIDYVNIRWDRNEKETFRFQRTFVNPSLRINNIHGKTRTTLSYNRKYMLPSTHLMFGQYSQYEYGRTTPGNYRLKPAVQDLIKLSFTTAKKATMLLELYYEVTKNPVVMLNRVNGAFITEQPDNLEKRKSIGAVVSISYTVRPFYSFTLNVDGRVNDHQFKQATFALNPHTWSGFSTFIHRFTVNKKLGFSFNASLHNWRTTLYRHMNSFITYAIQGNYKTNQRMNMSFSINDLFNNMKMSYTGTIAPGFYENGFSSNRMRNISFSIRYQLINSQMEKKTTTVKSFMSE